MEPIHVVGAAIIKGKNVLAAQRGPGMNEALKWEFPGGKVEENETHRQALEREVYEELGIRIKADVFIASGQSMSGGRCICLHVYEAELIEGVPVASEHTGFIWADINDILRLDWAEADIPACLELIKRYG